MDILQLVIFVIYCALVDARRSNGEFLGSIGNLTQPKYFVVEPKSTSGIRAEQRPMYRTGYACEGTKLDISCEPGHYIHLIRANYGRFSISICNEHGTLDWSVDCTSHRSFRVMSRSCAMKNSCSLPAATSMFGDPCPGTLKYLEAHYQCVPEKSTTSSSSILKPSPPPIVNPSSPHNTTSVRLPTTPLIIRPSTTTTTTTTSTTESTTVSTTPSTAWPTDDLPEVHTEPVFKPPYEEVVPTDPGPQDLGLLYCAPVMHRGILWNWTRAGDQATARCPKGATGDAHWQCDLSGDWATPRPDLSGCTSPWVYSLQDRVREGHPVVNIASELATMTQAKPLFGGDVIHTVDIIGQLVSHLDDRIAEFSDDRQRHQVVKELLKWVVDISNNLLNASQGQPWADLPSQDQRQVAAELLRGMEDNALLLADTRSSDLHFKYSKDNVLVAVDIVEMHKVEDITLPPPDRLDSGDSVFLPAEALLENSRNGLSKVVFVSYNPMLGRMLEPQSYLDTTVINSRIVSVSLGRQPVFQLSQPVVVTFKHLQEVNVSNPICVYWSYENKDWSEDGCRVQTFNRSHTSCACSHLTNFAVLMDIRATKLIYSHEKVLEILSYAGCSISIICLIFAILTFHFFSRVLKSDRTTIHKNLCFCLLVAEVLFVAGVHQTAQPVVCSVIAGLLHYFFLAAFSWMFLEGFQLYVMLIEVFETEKSRVKYYYAAAYSAPAVIVMVSALVDSSSYGTPDYCWLRADNYFILSFVGPVIFIVLANFVFLSIALYMMCKHSGMMTSVKSKDQTKLSSIKTWVRGAVVLVFLLGLTWSFGLFYLNEQSVIMAYLFVIFNSLQGLFIFIFHCIYNDKVQKEYQKYFRRGENWLPICLHKSKDAHRRPSLFINSNGTAQPTSGDLSSPQNSWSFRKDRKSSTNSSFLKSSSQSQNTEPGEPPVQRGTLRFVPGGLTVLDCPEYTAEKLAASAEMDRSLTTLTERNYGHLSERTLAAMAGMCPHRQFADHIYETIDDEAHPSLYPQLPEHHIRTHSCTSRQSSGSSDNYPLIARTLPHTLRLPPPEGCQSLDNLIEPCGPLVMAVLDGERVVCRLQPQELADAHRTQCHKLSQLSTDC